jgi:hypothetical protein
MGAREMKLSNIANVLDTEWDGTRLIEVGFTTVDIIKREILSTYSFPIKPKFEEMLRIQEGHNDPYWEAKEELSPEIIQLTGWTKRKLHKQGEYAWNIFVRMFEKYGFGNRLIIVDTPEEVPSLQRVNNNVFQAVRYDYSFSPNRLNITHLFKIMTGQDSNIGLDLMLQAVGLEFEGKRHRASNDSRNLARLFLKLTER